MKLSLPISEITYDNRRLDFVATAKDVSIELSKSGLPKLGFPNGCCIDTVDFFLENVDPNVDLVSVDVISPEAASKSLIAATVAVEVFCEEICGNGIDDDGDGYVTMQIRIAFVQKSTPWIRQLWKYVEGKQLRSVSLPMRPNHPITTSNFTASNTSQSVYFN
ncbi:MAG: hypothetical protein R2825_15165 [Saprospiraceae bacterium]